MESLFGLQQTQFDSFEAALRTARENLPSSTATHEQRTRFAASLNAFVRGSLNVSGLLRNLSDAVFDMLERRVVENYNETRAELAQAFERGLQALAGMADLVRDFESQGGKVATAESLRQAIAQAEKLRHDMLDHWKEFSEEDIKRGLEEYRRGECLEMDEMFAQIAGLSKEAWLGRVEERRRAKAS